MRSRWLSAAIVLAALIALGLQAEVVARTGFLMGDFRAFYCAARVASHGADPYHTEPLHTCEQSVASQRFFDANPGITIPAPLPGYVVGAIVPLAQLPFVVAASIWAVVLAAAWILAVLALARFAALPWQDAFAIFALALGALSLPFGEVVPISVAFICGAAYFLARARWHAAALCAAGAMAEPHLGLPVALALAIWAPRTRLALAVALAALGAVSLLALGLPANVEYFTSVLPAHALSEATRDTQYSLTAVLAALGVSAPTAAQLGTLWYFAMLAIGTVVAGHLARETHEKAFLACVPPAFAVFGGSFMHITQIAAALPAAVLLIPYVRAKYRALSVVILLLLAVPWGWVVSPALIIGPLFPVVYLAWRYWAANLTAVLLAGVAAAVLVLGLQQLHTVTGVHVTATTTPPVIDSRLAEASWSSYSRKMSSATPASWGVRIPTWAALFGLLVLLVATGEAKSEQCERSYSSQLPLSAP